MDNINISDTANSYPQVATYAALPAPEVSTDQIYVVQTATGVWPFNRHLAGMYRSDGAAWTYMGAYPDLLKDGNFGIQNSTDGTKVMKFSTAGVTTGNVRTLTMADEDINLTDVQNAAEIFGGVDGNGVVSGMALSINTDTTKFDIASGVYHIAGGSDVVYAGQAAVVPTYLATSLISFIGVNTSGAVVQSSTTFTPAQRRDYIVLGAIIHSNKTILNAINIIPDVHLSGLAQFNDLLDGLKNFNVTGNVISANGANLNINKSVGTLFKRGSNFNNDTKNPHLLTLNALTAPTNIRYRLRDGTEYANTAVVDPDYYDLAGVKTVVPPNKYTIQRAVLFTSNLIRIQYGQAVYGSKAEAIQAIVTESFVEESNIKENGLLRALLVVKSGTTALNSLIDSQFFEVERFGSSTFSAGGGGTTSMQQAYENSTQPQVITDATRGVVQYKRGTAADSDKVLEILNGAGASAAEFHGDVSNFGATAAGNYTQMEANGFMAAKGTAQAYKDISLSGLAFSAGGAAAPDIVDFVNTNCKTFGFDGAATTERLYITTEMQHDYAEGTDLELHIHWTPTTADAGDVKWQVYYTWQSVNGTFGAPTLLSVASTARGTAWQNTYGSFGTISGAGKVINSQLVIQLFRDPGDAADTYGADAALVALGIHYKCDTIGSRAIGTK